MFVIPVSLYDPTIRHCIPTKNNTRKVNHDTKVRLPLYHVTGILYDKAKIKLDTPICSSTYCILIMSTLQHWGGNMSYRNKHY